MGVYGLGWLFPDQFWSVHHLAFLPASLQVIIPLLALGVPIYFHWQGYRLDFEKPLGWSKQRQNLVFAVVAILLGVVFYQFPIVLDTYGDANYLKPQINQKISTWNSQLLTDFFAFKKAGLKVGTKTYYNLINLLTFLTGKTGLEVAQGWAAFMGMSFVWLWLKLVAKHIKERLPFLILAIAGIAAPVTLNFYGHYEVYALPIAGTLVVLHAFTNYYQEVSKRNLIWLWLAFLLQINLHITAIFIAPALALTTLHFMKRKTDSPESWLTWQKLKFTLLLPLVLLGIGFYFLSGSFSHTRRFDPNALSDNLFLPVVATDPAPLDKYNLFSWNHFFDYGSVFFIWSGTAMFVLLLALIAYRKKVHWNHPFLLVLSITLLLYLAFFFVINPLLSLPNDWDLFSLASPILLGCMLLLAKQLKELSFPKTGYGIVVGLTVLGAATFPCNTIQSAHSQHLESYGTYIYKTYWLGSSTTFNGGISLAENDSIAQVRRLALIEKLAPYAVLGNDIEYADLLHKAGKHHYEQGNFEAALPYFQTAQHYEETLRKNPYHLVITLFMLGEYQQAAEHLPLMTAIAYPDEKKALRIGIHVALEAEAYPEALEYAKQYLEVWPDDATIQKVARELEGGKDLERIKLYFRRG